jgi:hypothetical protein
MGLLHFSQLAYHMFFICSSSSSSGTWGGIVVKALRYKSMGPGIDPGDFTEDFFPGASTVSCALESTQPQKMSTRKLLEGEGGRCVKVTTLPP